MSLFERIEEIILTQTVDEILYDDLKRFYGYSDCDNITYEELHERYEKEQFNELNETLEYFKENILDIQTNFSHYKNMYNILEDHISRETFEYMLAAKIFMDLDYVQKAFSDEIIYFSKNIFSFSKEVYLDCGGFDGDTVISFADQVKDVDYMYVFESMQGPAEICSDRIKKNGLHEKTTLFQNAVYDKMCELRFNLGMGAGDSSVDENGNICVSAVKIDDCVSNRATFIKMDIEGSEKNAIIGAEQLIKANTPKMAICIYHLKDDFWKIPELILSINPHYKFMVRQHDPASFAETVLYCIPDTMEKAAGEDPNYNKVEKDLAIYKKDKVWFLRQLRYKDKELAKLKEIENAKMWLSEQYVNLNKRIKELEDWTRELEEGKNWLSGQYDNLIKRNEELEAWVKVLKGKNN